MFKENSTNKMLSAKEVGEMLCLSKRQIFRLNLSGKFVNLLCIDGSLRWSRHKIENGLRLERRTENNHEILKSQQKEKLIESLLEKIELQRLEYVEYRQAMIRQNCLECMEYNRREIPKCTTKGCPFFKFCIDSISSILVALPDLARGISWVVSIWNE